RLHGGAGSRTLSRHPRTRSRQGARQRRGVACMHATALPPNALQYIVGGGIALALMAFRMSRMTRQRPLRVEQLWIVPLLFMFIAALTMVAAPPALSDARWLIGATIFGGIVGWYR